MCKPSVARFAGVHSSFFVHSFVQDPTWHTVGDANTYSDGHVTTVLPQFCVPCKRQKGRGHHYDPRRRRYRCKVRKQTFSERLGTMFEGVRKPIELVIIVVTLLSYGCPVQAIVQTFGLDERTVAQWRDRASQHYQKVHEAIVEQGQLDLVHVQADELRVKGRKLIAWMGLAMMVPTRLWVAGTVRRSRDKGLTDHLWSFGELLCYKVVPSPWFEPKKRGRPPKQTRSSLSPNKKQSSPSRTRPLVRLRKGILCSTTS